MLDDIARGVVFSYIHHYKPNNDTLTYCDDILSEVCMEIHTPRKIYHIQNLPALFPMLSSVRTSMAYVIMYRCKFIN